MVHWSCLLRRATLGRDNVGVCQPWALEYDGEGRSPTPDGAQGYNRGGFSSQKSLPWRKRGPDSIEARALDLLQHKISSMLGYDISANFRYGNRGVRPNKVERALFRRERWVLGIRTLI